MKKATHIQRRVLTASLTIAVIIALGFVARCDLSRFGRTPKLTESEITLQFRESLTRITATRGDILEVATLESDETVSRVDAKSAFGNLLPLGTSVAEIRVPVVYRYHIKLSEEWTVRLDPRGYRVTAPVVRPSLPPAIVTDRMEKSSESGWLRFNEAENLAELERSLTPLLKNRAATPQKIDLVREAARKAVKQFVLTWLLTDADPDQTVIEIQFRDEADDGLLR